MAALNFPSNPTIDQEYTLGDLTYRWDGSSWNSVAVIPETDLTGYATETYVDDAIAAIPETDLTGYATETYVDDAIAAIPEVDLSGYVTQADLAAGTITVDVNNTGDLTGSVFADDSTLLVDGVNGKIVGPVDTATITASALNLNISARNYVYVDSNEGGSIVIGQGENSGSVVVGKADGIFTVNSDAYLNGGLTIANDLITFNTTKTAIRADDTDKGLVIEGPNYADFVTQEGGSISTISNGVNIVTHRAGSNAERRWTFAWDGALYPPNEPGDYQIGTIEWRQTAPYDITNQIRTTEGDGVTQFPGLKLTTYPSGVDAAAITLESGFDNRWIFKNDGVLSKTDSSGLTLAANFDVKIVTDYSDNDRTWTFNGSSGSLTFPDNSEQTTAFLSEDLGQVGYQIEIAADIYENVQGGAVTSTTTTVDLGTADIVRTIFNIQPTSTSTDATVTQVGEDWVLTVNTLSGESLTGNESVWLAGGALVADLSVATPNGAGSWILGMSYGGGEILTGTEFEFYPGGWTNYTPLDTVTIDWDSGETTEVLYGEQNNPYSSSIVLVTAEDQTTLQYPIVVTTADFDPSSHSIVLDGGLGFKITSKASDFIIDGNEKPVVIRAGLNDIIFDTGSIIFPDDTVQTTAFLGGSPTQLANGDATLVLGSDGGLTFPDGTVQTTAYAANPGEPLFVVINSDGTNAWSSDGTTWTQGSQLVAEGYSFERVAIANSYIAYVLGGPVPGALAYATTYGVTPTEVTFSTTGTEYYSWVDLQYADGYTVAVGAFYGDDGEGGNLPSVPVWAYTTNGSSWTIGNTDPLYQDGYPNGSFQSIDYGAGGWFFVASAEDTEPGNGAAGFFTTSLSSQLTLDNYIQFGDSLEGYWPNIASVVWDGSRWWVNDQDNANMYVSSGSNPLTSTWTTVSLETVAIDAGFGDTGPDFYEDAGGQINGTSWFVIANDEGQVLASNDGGETWIGSVPLAYTDTLATATQASPCAVTFTDRSPAGQGEKIVISNANPSDYNGTYYVQNNLGTYELYVDNGGSTPLDSTLFGALVSADVLWSHGQYIDSVGFGLEKFLVGNDDEQLFTSTDLETWTKVDDQSEEGFQYWNDFSFNATWGASGVSVETDRLINGSASLLLGSDGNVTFPNDLSIQNFGAESIMFKSGDTFGIGGDQATFLQWQNYLPGQGPGKQSVVQTYDGGVTFYVSDPGDDTTYVWEFTNDGTTYLSRNSTSPISYLQTPLNNTDIGLYIGAGNGVTIAANDYSEGTFQWDFTPQGRLQFPGSGTANYSIGETEGGIEISSDYAIILTANVANSGQEKYFIVYDDGKVRLPGATYSAPASPTAGAYPVGETTAITVTNSPNTNWVTGNGVFINGMTFAIAVDGSGNATVTSISDGGTGHYVGETFGPIVGTAFGGTSPADDMYFEVTAINLGSLTALDLTKQTQILTGDTGTNTGSYSLADGTEGQIMYFVPASGTSGAVYVRIANARIIDVNGTGLPADVTDYSWNVFAGESNDPTSIMMAIFADGAWCLRGGVTD